MSTKLKNAQDIVKASLPELKKDLSQAATYVRSLAFAGITGAASAGAQFLTNVGHEETLFTQAGILKLKHTFIYGAAISLIGLFTPSPLKNTVAPVYNSVNTPSEPK